MNISVGQPAAPAAARQPSAPPAFAAPTPVDQTDVIMGQIRKLAELHEAGVLTSVEFESKKAELLGRL